MIDILMAGADVAQEWLEQHRGSDGFANISEADWSSAAVVIEDVRFERIRLAHHSVFCDFAKCGFEKSEFSDLTTDGHFWGSANHWFECDFRRLDLTSVISPTNVFTSCCFENVVFDGYLAHQTLFESCRFINCKFVALRAEPNRRRTWTIERMANLGTSLQFIECDFVASEFKNCIFKDIGFRSSAFDSPAAVECDFTGIESDRKWWPQSSQADVFVSFLNQVISTIYARLGDTASAAAVLSRYRTEYLDGVTRSKDYSACLYTGDISNEELDAVEDILDEIGPKYGLLRNSPRDAPAAAQRRAFPNEVPTNQEKPLPAAGA